MEAMAVAVAVALALAVAVAVAVVEEMTARGRSELELELGFLQDPSSSDPRSTPASADSKSALLLLEQTAVTSAKIDEEGECQYLPEVEGVGRLEVEVEVALGAVKCT